MSFHVSLIFYKFCTVITIAKVRTCFHVAKIDKRLEKKKKTCNCDHLPGCEKQNEILVGVKPILQLHCLLEAGPL